MPVDYVLPHISMYIYYISIYIHCISTVYPLYFFKIPMNRQLQLFTQLLCHVLYFSPSLRAGSEAISFLDCHVVPLSTALPPRNDKRSCPFMGFFTNANEHAPMNRQLLSLLYLYVYLFISIYLYYIHLSITTIYFFSPKISYVLSS